MRITSIREVLVASRRAEIAPECTLEQAFEVMDHHKVTVVAVTRNGRVCGILCADDIIRHVSQFGGLRDTEVRAVMTVDVTFAETRDCLTDVCHKMRAGGFSHMPVLDLTGRLVGILHRSDIPCDQIKLATRLPAAA